jgi:hypothetical protein
LACETRSTRIACERVDRHIDQLVFRHHGLTGDEIRIVEEVTA